MTSSPAPYRSCRDSVNLAIRDGYLSLVSCVNAGSAVRARRWLGRVSVLFFDHGHAVRGVLGWWPSDRDSRGPGVVAALRRVSVPAPGERAAVDAGSTAGVFEPGDLSVEDALPEAQCLGGLVDAGVLGGPRADGAGAAMPVPPGSSTPSASSWSTAPSAAASSPPTPPLASSACPAFCCVHSGLLVFTKPGKPASSAELKDSRH
jgi:hypothetical protein